MLTGHASRLRTTTAVLLVLFAAYAVALPGVAEAQGEEAVLTVTVTDSATGKPLAGASVTAYTYSRANAMKDGGTTDEAGRVALALADGTAEVHAFLDGYDPATSVVEVAGATSHAVTLSKVPERDAQVTGRVLGPDGAPLAGARVTLATWCCAGTPMPAEDTPESEGAATTTIAPSKPMIAPDYRHEYQETTTDGEGRYAFKAYAGEKQLTFQANGHALLTKEIAVVAGENDAGDATLEKIPPRDAILVGRVIDRATGAGVAYAGVSLQNMEWGDYNWTQTDANGAFRFATYPGYVRLDVHAGSACYDIAATDGGGATGSAGSPAIAEESVARDDIAIMPAPMRCAPNPAQYYSYATTLDAKVGENRVDAKLAPKPTPTLVVAGYVLDANERGIPGAWVNVRNEDTGEWGHAVTDEFGSYKFLVRPGYLVIEAGAHGHFANVAIAESDGAKPVRADIVLRAGEAKNGGCYDCVIMYGAAEPASAPEPMPPATATGEKQVAETGGASGGDDAAGDGGVQRTSISDAPANAEGAATYEGSGGGLGPYRAGSAGVEPGGANPVPGVAFGAALVAVGVVAVALARRRS